MKAAKRLVFGICQKLVHVDKVAHPIRGYCVQLGAVAEMIVREQRLHQIHTPVLKLMIKIDGRPFWGKESFWFDLSLCMLVKFHNYMCLLK